MYTLSLTDLFFAFIPVLLVLIIMIYKSLQYKTALYALARMFLQLLLIGYFLIYIFKTESSYIVLATLSVMLLAASWIALRTVKEQKALYFKALLSIGIGGGFTLVLITQFVLELQPWYQPSYMIPLAGMIFANAMTAISLAAERFELGLSAGIPNNQASTEAFNTALIPVINGLFAVGLVSLPGMMTGQILSGVSPLIAARYQIMVMAMIFGASGLSVLLFLQLIKHNFSSTRNSDV